MFNSQSLSAQQSVNTTASIEISSSANDLLTIDDKVVRSTDFLGLSMSTLLVCLWCLNTYRSFKKQGLRPTAGEIIWPILLIGLLFRNAIYLQELTFAPENTVNSIKTPLNKVTKKGSRSLIAPVTCAEQNCKSTGRSGIAFDNYNLSTADAMRNAHIQESTIRLYNYYSME